VSVSLSNTVKSRPLVRIKHIHYPQKQTDLNTTPTGNSVDIKPQQGIVVLEVKANINIEDLK